MAKLLRPLFIGRLLVLASCAPPTVEPTAVTPTEFPTAETAEAPSASEPAVGESSLPMDHVPLEQALDDLRPQVVFASFYDITQVPRPSGKMEQIRAFLVSFGEGLFTVDEETDMSGINGLAAGVLHGTTLINLDSEEEGTFTIGRARGERASIDSSYNQEPTVSAVHAGLECGVVTGTYPDMDMISIGPTLEDVHSPSERLYIPSVARTMDLLTETLQQMPEVND